MSVGSRGRSSRGRARAGWGCQAGTEWGARRGDWRALGKSGELYSWWVIVQVRSARRHNTIHQSILIRFGWVLIGPRCTYCVFPRVRPCLSWFFETETHNMSVGGNYRKLLHVLCSFRPRPKLFITKMANMDVKTKRPIAMTAERYIR